jgi:hypothetical protein
MTDDPKVLNFNLIYRLAQLGVRGMTLTYEAAAALKSEMKVLCPNIGSDVLTRHQFGEISGIAFYYHHLRFHMREVVQVCAWSMELDEPLPRPYTAIRYDAIYEHRVTGDRISLHHLFTLRDTTNADSIKPLDFERYREEASAAIELKKPEGYARLENVEQLIPLPPGLKIARYV